MRSLGYLRSLDLKKILDEKNLVYIGSLKELEYDEYNKPVYITASYYKDPRGTLYRHKSRISFLAVATTCRNTQIECKKALALNFKNLLTSIANNEEFDVQDRNVTKLQHHMNKLKTYIEKEVTDEVLLEIEYQNQINRVIADELNTFTQENNIDKDEIVNKILEIPQVTTNSVNDRFKDALYSYSLDIEPFEEELEEEFETELQ